jgi:hypothetical protein
MDAKTCIVCGETKSLDDFFLYPGQRPSAETLARGGGRMLRCKPCWRELRNAAERKRVPPKGRKPHVHYDLADGHACPEDRGRVHDIDRAERLAYQMDDNLIFNEEPAEEGIQWKNAFHTHYVHYKNRRYLVDHVVVDRLVRFEHPGLRVDRAGRTILAVNAAERAYAMFRLWRQGYNDLEIALRVRAESTTVYNFRYTHDLRSN